MKKLNTALILIFVLLITSCEKEISCENCIPVTIPEKELPVIDPGDTLYYYQLYIDNTYYEEIAYQHNTVLGNGWIYSSDIDSGLIMSSGLITNNGGGMGLGPGTLSVSNAIIKNATKLTEQEYMAYYAPGNYPYYSFNPELGMPAVLPLPGGVYISWVDKNGNLWASNYGLTDQPGSYFRITSVEAVDFSGNINNDVDFRFKAEFKVILYNKQNKAMLINKAKLAFYVRQS